MLPLIALTAVLLLLGPALLAWLFYTIAITLKAIGQLFAGLALIPRYLIRLITPETKVTPDARK